MEKIQYKHKKTGSIVTWDGGVYTTPNNIYVIPNTFVEGCDDWEEIKEIILPEPEKKLLFVSHDSLDIYEGDDIWIVKTVRNDFDVDIERNFKGFKQQYGYRYFKLFNNADEWIKKNKPVYSFHQIKTALYRVHNQFSSIYPIDFIKSFEKEIEKIKTEKK